MPLDTGIDLNHQSSLSRRHAANLQKGQAIFNEYQVASLPITHAQVRANEDESQLSTPRSMTGRDQEPVVDLQCVTERFSTSKHRQLGQIYKMYQKGVSLDGIDTSQIHLLAVPGNLAYSSMLVRMISLRDLRPYKLQQIMQEIALCNAI